MTDTTLPFDPAANGWIQMPEEGFPSRLGGFWRRVDGDAVLYGLLTDDGHRNRNGRIHGGVVLGLADHAIGHTSVDSGQGRAQATMQLDVQFVAAPNVGDFLMARCSVVRMTRSVVFMRAEITAGDRLVATGTGLWKILGA